MFEVLLNFFQIFLIFDAQSKVNFFSKVFFRKSFWWVFGMSVFKEGAQTIVWSPASSWSGLKLRHQNIQKFWLGSSIWGPLCWPRWIRPPCFAQFVCFQNCGRGRTFYDRASVILWILLSRLIDGYQFWASLFCSRCSESSTRFSLTERFLSWILVSNLMIDLPKRRFLQVLCICSLPGPFWSILLLHGHHCCHWQWCFQPMVFVQVELLLVLLVLLMSTIVLKQSQFVAVGDIVMVMEKLNVVIGLKISCSPWGRGSPIGKRWFVFPRGVSLIVKGS